MKTWRTTRLYGHCKAGAGNGLPFGSPRSSQRRLNSGNPEHGQRLAGEVAETEVGALGGGGLRSLQQVEARLGCRPIKSKL